MRVYLGVIILLGLCLLPAASHAKRDGPSPLEGCLQDAARGKRPVSDCHTLVSGACLDEIADAGGNLGNSAIRICTTEQLVAWFEAWAFGLQAAQRGARDPAAVLARFRNVQVQAAGKCLKPPSDPIMVKTVECMSEVYGPFLVEEIRRGRSAQSVAEDEAAFHEILKRMREGDETAEDDFRRWSERRRKEDALWEAAMDPTPRTQRAKGR